MTDISIKILEKSQHEEFYEQILKMLYDADEEFFPPLSARTSTTQSVSGVSVDTDKGGILSYFEAMKQQRLMVACDDSGKLLAFVSYRENFVSDAICDEELPNIYISTLIVSPMARGQGMTYTMYEKLIEAYSDSNIFTRTWSTNNAHLRILAKFDFKTFKTLKDDRAKGVDTVYFKKSKNI